MGTTLAVEPDGLVSSITKRRSIMMRDDSDEAAGYSRLGRAMSTPAPTSQGAGPIVLSAPGSLVV